jgi:hypothetical protein
MKRRPEGILIQFVVPGSTVPGFPDQTGRLENPEMSRDRGPGNVEERGDAARRLATLAEGFEYGSPGGVGQRGKDGTGFGHRPT